MKKSGFTLAEILISLGIIGIIAAVVTPSLAINTQNRANATKLSTASSTIENALGMMITKEDADDLSETELGSANNNDKAVAALEKYIQIETVQNDEYTGAMTSYIQAGDTGNALFKTKSGAIVYILKDSTADFDKIYVDVNGNDKPNKEGRDIFAYYIDRDNGSLIPFGSVKANDIDSNGTWNAKSATYTCTTDNLSLGCTARLSEHTYKVDY